MRPIDEDDRAARRRLARKRAGKDSGWRIIRRSARRSTNKPKETIAERRERLDGERQERRREYKVDTENAPALQRQVIELYSALFEPVVSRGQSWRPEGLLDQLHAAEKRNWQRRWAMTLRRSQLRELGLQRGQYQKYAVTLARPEWILHDLDPCILPKIRKQVQRQAKRLSLPYVVTAIVDVCPLRDVLSGTEGWAFHVHLTIQLAVSDYEVGKVAIKKAFPYESNSSRGVPRARVIEPAFDARGWDGYQSKLFVYGKVKTRIVYVADWSRQLRQKSRKRPMRVPLAVELATFFSEIRADDLMIWVRHRRRGDQILPI